MAGYWKQPELTAEMLKPGLVPGENILCSGDLFHMDAEGFLYFAGRSDDIIKTRGEKVSPAEVEQVLHGMEGIREAVVIGVDEIQLGQAIYAFVVQEKGVNLSERKVKKFCLSRLENFMVPHVVVFVEKMPKTANGKVDKKLLLQQFCP